MNYAQFATQIEDMNKKIKSLERRCCCEDGGSGDCCYEVVTLQDLNDLIDNDLIEPNKMYKVTGVHKNKDPEQFRIPVLYDDGTNSGTDIFLMGLSPNEVSTEGWGIFYNPKYDKNNYGGPDPDIDLYPLNIVGGTGYSEDTGVPTTGGSGVGMTVDIFVDTGVVTGVQIVNQGSGYQEGDVITIDSGDNNATFTLYVPLRYLYNIWDGDNPQGGYDYAPNRKIIWGGYVWEQTAGIPGAGGAETYTSLTSDFWTKIPYNEEDYNKVIDYIEYDLANDWIVRRRQAEPVIDIIFPSQFWNSDETPTGEIILHGIAVTQWGNKFDSSTNLGSGLLNINDSYLESANFKGRNMLGITMGNYSWDLNNYRGINTVFQGITFDNYSYQYFCKFDTGASQKYITFNNYSYQNRVKINTDSNQEYITFNNGSWQEMIEGGEIRNNSLQQYISFNNGSYQTSLILDNSTQTFFTFENDAYSSGDNITDSFQTTFSIKNGGVITQHLDGASQYKYTVESGYFINIPITSPVTMSNTKITNGLIEYYIPLTFDGNAGSGLEGAVTIPQFTVPLGWYIHQVVTGFNNLTYDVNAALLLGVEVDDTTAGLDAVTGLFSTIGVAPTTNTNLPYTITTDERRISIEIVDGDVTDGQLFLYITLRKGN